MGTFLATVLLDVDLGLFFGLFLSLLLIAMKDQNINLRSLIKYEKTSFFVDQDLIPLNVSKI